MEWIQTEIERTNFLSDLVDLIVQYGGWTHKASYTVIDFRATELTDDTGTRYYDGLARYAIHSIVESPQGKFLGLVMVSKTTDPLRVLAEPIDENAPVYLSSVADRLKERENTYHDGLEDKFMYAYMVERADLLPTHEVIMRYRPTSTTDLAVHKWTEAQYILDIEVSTNDNGLIIYNSSIMQSPIALLEFRNAEGNWWPDSKISIVGNITDRRLFLTFAHDTLPLWEKNQIPSVPLFFGDIQSFDSGDIIYNTALFTGSLLPRYASEPLFMDNLFSTVVADDEHHEAHSYLPLRKTYPTRPGDGRLAVIVNRGKMGGRYQAHYLSVAVPPDLMRPTRTTSLGSGYEDVTYPRDWHTRYDHPSYNMRFNPSLYTNKVHSSCIYVVHPEEGVRGLLSDMIGVVPLSLVDGDKLIVNEGEFQGTYRFLLVEGYSALTAQPGVAYKPIGVGLRVE
jgi:hypothetical protein